MDLTQLKPKESSFTIDAINHTFKMMPITLADEVWIKETFGQEGIKEMFLNLDMPNIVRLAFRFIHSDDKKFFKAKEVTFITEEGEEVVTLLGGIELLKSIISGEEDKVNIINALLDNIGISRPKVNEEDIKVKKKAIRKKK